MCVFCSGSSKLYKKATKKLESRQDREKKHLFFSLGQSGSDFDTLAFKAFISRLSFLNKLENRIFSVKSISFYNPKESE